MPLYPLNAGQLELTQRAAPPNTPGFGGHFREFTQSWKDTENTQFSQGVEGKFLTFLPYFCPVKGIDLCLQKEHTAPTSPDGGIGRHASFRY